MNKKINKKKPPDKYKTFKISFKQLIKQNIDYSNLIDAVIRTNKLTILVYQFMRAFIIYKYEKNKNAPIIDESFINLAFKCLRINGRGPKPKGTNLLIFKKLTKFYDKYFKKLINDEKIDGTNLSQIIGYSCTDILTNIENNIKMNFFKYLNRFVNQSFKEKNENILKELKGEQKNRKKKELNKELYLIKQDLKNNTLVSNKKYHKWIENNRNKILPKEYKNSYEYDISINPQKYLKYMIKMNKFLQQKDLKQFQFFPLRTDIIPKYIQFDTKSLIELFKCNSEYLFDIENNKDFLWKKYFNLDHKIFKQKNYEFDYNISTDGFAVSIRFIHKNFIEKENQKKINLRKARQNAKNIKKTKNEKEIDDLKNKKINDKKQANEKIKLEIKNKKDKFKLLPKEEKKKIIEENKKNKYNEFPYFDKLNSEQKQELKKSKLVYVDPGKRSIYYMVDDNGNYFNYTNKMRINETKRLKYQTLRKNFKIKHGMVPIETELTNFNSKTCSFEEFCMYVQKKNEINNKLFKLYEDKLFRKLNWFSYLNTKRSEDNLVNKIIEHYGKDAKIIMGDYNNSNRVHYMSTPGIGLKRKLAEKKVFNLDEFRTSSLHHITEEKCSNLCLPDKKNKYRKIHSILTYQMENKRKGCINRDKNAVQNMRKIVLNFFETGKRLEKFKRERKKRKKIKRDINLLNYFENTIKIFRNILRMSNNVELKTKPKFKFSK